MIDKTVFVMGLLRVLSGSFEIIAAIIILKLNNVEKALIVNSSLAMVGPVILIVTTAVGLLGISEKLSATKILFVFLGVILILIGIKSR